MSFKDTLNLPRTSFPQKAGLKVREPETLARWDEMDLYGRIQAARRDAPLYMLHDGPPYANGDAHIGTGVNKILKDVVVRYKAMRGYRAPFVPGWDCHGLPIEHKVMRELGADAESVPVPEIRRRCREYAEHYRDVQRRQFIRLGGGGDWQNPYLTFTPDYEHGVLSVFEDLVRGGYVYRAKRSIHWCMSCKTALAEAELEYKDDASPSIYVRFPARDSLAERLGLPRESLGVLIWTTTPWTIPANLAIALHPRAEYAVVRHAPETYSLVARELVESLAEKLSFDECEVVKTVVGADLEGATTRHPLIDRDSPIVLAEYVTLEDGTGCVHTAPGHGAEDYETGVRYGLDIYCPVDEEGRFTSDVPEFRGRNVHEANPDLIVAMREAGSLLLVEKSMHSYPHCWRCKEPVIFRATDQWFVAVEHEDLRGRALKEVTKTTWYPRWGEKRITGMLVDRPDWCISRQRAWGVPIPAFHCNACEAVHLDGHAIAHLKAIVAEKGVDVWFQSEAADLLPAGTVCAGCGGADFRKGTDIFDVWFESGSSWRSVMVQHPDLDFPADLYLEGSDQHRGWFQLSLLPAVAATGGAPFRAVLTHGFIVDENGEKISKSKGGLVPVEKLAEEFGADVLRLWAVSGDFRNDIPFSPDIVKRSGEPYRKIRNTLRFLLGNLADFDPGRDAVAEPDLAELDRWALAALRRMLARVTSFFDAFETHRVCQTITNFCATEMSAVYLDILKDRLYTLAPNDARRRGSQTVMHRILDALTRVLAPVLVFTAEEAWSHIPGDREESVHLALWPAVDATPDEELLARFDRLLAIRTDVLRQLEGLRAAKKIGNSLEAVVELHTTDLDLSAFLGSFPEGDLEAAFIVSAVGFPETRPADAVDGEEVPSLAVAARPSPHEKCPRCWRRVAGTGSNAEHPDLCDRCASVIGGEV